MELDDGPAEGKIEEIACGSDFTLVLKSDKNVYSMGLNGCGQLGQGDLQSRKDDFVICD
jgi:alpha-tubulin suppressor-like RCC1 family protein